MTFAGTVNWSGGAMAGTGTTKIAVGATLNISNSVALAGVLETDGPTNWTGNSAINMDNGTINNYGTWTANSSSTLQADGNPGGVNAFNNESSGTFTQQGTGTTYFTNYETGAAFNNAGQVNVSQGGLDLASGGSQTGAFSIAAGSTFLLNGTQNFSAASTVNCAGTLSVSGGTASFSNTPTIAALNVSGGTADFNAASGFGSLNFSGGTLSGTGNVTFAGTVNWSGGAMAGTGTTKIAVGATLNISNSVALAGVLETDGPTNWTGNSAINMDNGTINNYGTWTANSSSTLQADGNPGGVNAFNNESSGTFTQQGTGTTYFTNYETGVAFNNAGQVNVSQGGLDLASGGSQTGAFSIAAGSTFLLNGTQNFSAASTVNCAGTLSVSGGTASFSNTPTIAALNVSGGTADFNAASGFGSLNFSGGTLSGTGNVTFAGTVNWSGGAMAGTGTTKIAVGATLNISNSVALAGVLETDGPTNWTGNSTINMDNGTINNYGTWTANSSSTLQADGNPGGVNAFNNESSGTFTQQGTGTTYFTNYETGVAFNNAGQVNVSQGGLDLASGGSQTGAFSIAAGSTYLLNGTQNFSAASTVNCAGTLSVPGGTASFSNTPTIAALNVSGGTADFNAASGFGSLNFSGGTLSGTGNVTFAGTVNWSGGAMAGTGTTKIAVGATLNI